jgi:hypothetical protein
MGDTIGGLVIQFVVINPLADSFCFLGLNNSLGNLSEDFDIAASFQHPDIIQLLSSTD